MIPEDTDTCLFTGTCITINSSVPLSLHPFTLSMNKLVLQGTCACNRDIGMVFTRIAQQGEGTSAHWAEQGQGVDFLFCSVSELRGLNVDTRQDITVMIVAPGTYFPVIEGQAKEMSRDGFKEHAVV